MNNVHSSNHSASSAGGEASDGLGDIDAGSEDYADGNDTIIVTEEEDPGLNDLDNASFGTFDDLDGNGSIGGESVGQLVSH